jgi:hypothetical protein
MASRGELFRVASPPALVQKSTLGKHPLTVLKWYRSPSLTSSSKRDWLPTNSPPQTDATGRTRPISTFQPTSPAPLGPSRVERFLGFHARVTGHYTAVLRNDSGARTRRAVPTPHHASAPTSRCRCDLREPASVTSSAATVRTDAARCCAPTWHSAVSRAPCLAVTGRRHRIPTRRIRRTSAASSLILGRSRSLSALGLPDRRPFLSAWLVHSRLSAQSVGPASFSRPARRECHAAIGRIVPTVFVREPR